MSAFVHRLNKTLLNTFSEENNNIINAPSRHFFEFNFALKNCKFILHQETVYHLRKLSLNISKAEMK